MDTMQCLKLYSIFLLSNSGFLIIFLLFIFQFDDLVEVFTDKLVAKIPSAADGTVIEIKKLPDEVCLVGHSLMSIRVDDEDGDEANASSSSTSSSDEEAA